MTDSLGTTQKTQTASASSDKTSQDSLNPFKGADPSICEVSTVETAMNTSISHGLSSTEAQARLEKLGQTRSQQNRKIQRGRSSWLSSKIRLFICC